MPATPSCTHSPGQEMLLYNLSDPVPKVAILSDDDHDDDET